MPFDFVTLTLVIILAPLVSALINGLFCRVLSRGVAYTQAIFCMLICCLSAMLLFYQYHTADGIAAGGLSYNLYTWADITTAQISVGLLIDKMSIAMMAMISFVSLFVHIYSIGYMHDDPCYARFFAYVSLFTFAMLTLVSANNFMQLFFAWEGVGLVSYLLIGFWFEKPSAAAGGFKAFVVNRIGDLGFLLGIGVLFALTGTLLIPEIYNKIPSLSGATFAIGQHVFQVPELVGVLLFVGAMGKSAQLPLHIWLPESMEGPTPISALIHAATMVTAGVFLLCRMSPILEYASFAKDLILMIGSTGALILGAVALVQFDIKRVVAYSTLSQLGYMMAGVGSGAYSIAMFHLLTHAFFKALLFLAAGSVIVALHHEQDMRKMGGLWRKLPVTYTATVVGSFALMAVPPFAGYFSKESIIDSVALLSTPVAHYSLVCLIIGAGVTAAYSVRALLMTFHGPCHYKGKVSEPGVSILIALLVLVIPSFMSGRLMLDTIFNGQLLGTQLADQNLAAIAHHWQHHYLDANLLEWFSGWIHSPATLATLFGVVAAILVYKQKNQHFRQVEVCTDSQMGL